MSLLLLFGGGSAPPSSTGADWFDSVTLYVEVGFSSTASTPLASTTWTDVSAYVRNLTWRYGRTSEFDDITPGSATVTLDNRDRRFDPDYSSGPYYGNVLPMRRIRIRAVYSSTSYNLWSGFVESWPQTYVQDADALVDVPCVDVTAILAQARIEAHASEQAIMALSPTAYHSFDERTAVVRRKTRTGALRVNDPTKVADDSGNGKTATIEASYSAFDQASITQADSLARGGSALRLGGGSSYAMRITGPDAAVADAATSLVGWFSVTAPDSTAAADYDIPIMAVVCSSTSGGNDIRATCRVYLRYDADTSVAHIGVRALALDDATTHNVAVGGWIPYNFGDPVFVGLSSLKTGTPVVVVNGVELTGTAPSMGGTPQSDKLFMAYGPGWRSAIYSGTFSTTSDTYGQSVTFDEVAYWNGTQLSAAQMLGIYNAGKDARDNERSGSRVGYVLDGIDWPTADRSIEDGETWLGPLSEDRGSALNALSELQTTEQGRIFAGPDGKVYFQARTHDADQSSNFTFSDSAYGDVTIETSRQTLYNRVTVAQESTGSTYLAEDAISQGKYLRNDDTLTVNAHDGSYCSALASWRLARYKDPVSRIPSLSFKPRRSPTTLVPQALGRTVGDVITVTRTPQAVGSAISKTVVIEGVSHTLTAGGEWSVDWYVGPGPNTGPWLTLGDATLGKLGVAAGNKLHF